jgi:hypothetical protein
MDDCSCRPGEMLGRDLTHCGWPEFYEDEETAVRRFLELMELSSEPCCPLSTGGGHDSFGTHPPIHYGAVHLRGKHVLTVR